MGALIPARIANVPGLSAQLLNRGFQPLSDRPSDFSAATSITVNVVNGSNIRGYTARHKHIALYSATHVAAIVGNITGDNGLSETPGRNNVQFKIAFQKNGSPSSATFTTNPSPGDTLTINGVAIAFLASGASGNQVNIGATTALTVASLAALINANTATFKCTATAAAAVLTCQTNAGVDPGSVAWSKSSAAITLYGTTLLGGSTGWNDQSQPRVPAFLNGSKWIDVPPGGIAQTDPVAFEVAAGEAFFTYIYIGATGTSCLLPSGAGLMGGGNTIGACNNGDARASDDALDSGSLSLSATLNIQGPLAIVGASSAAPKTVGIVGDSLVNGTADFGGYPNRGGYLERMMMGHDQAVNLSASVEQTRAPNFAFIKYSRGGDTLANFVNRANFFQGARLLAMCSTVVSELGINDIGGGPPLATMQANYLALAAYFTSRGIKFIQCTMPPRTSSTDKFLTIGNQTVSANEALRIGVNSWLRDTSAAGFVAQTNTPGLADVWDAGAFVEVNSSGVLAINGGFWPAAYSTNLATGTLTAIGGTTYTDSALSISPDQWRGYHLRMTNGAASGNFSAITGNNSAGQMILSSAVTGGPSVGDAYQICMMATPDGTHPTTESHRRIAAGLIASGAFAKII